jgi:hypothetical protein
MGWSDVTQHLILSSGGFTTYSTSLSSDEASQKEFLIPYS